MIKGYRQDPVWKLGNDSTATARGGKAQHYSIGNGLLYATTRGGEKCLYIPKEHATNGETLRELAISERHNQGHHSAPRNLRYTTEYVRGTGRGFGSTGIGLELKETEPMICFLHSSGNHEFFNTADTHQHPIFHKGRILLSNIIIAKANLRKVETDVLDKVGALAKDDEEWMRRKEELESMLREGKEVPKQWTITDNLLYYKDRLYIPSNKDLQTLIAKGCHNSQVAGHVAQDKTFEIIMRDFYWKNITNWINDYVRSCTTCQQAKAPRHARYRLLNPLQVPYSA